MMSSTLRDFYLNDQYWFYQAEIGVDDCLPYLQHLPPIDLVYSALPKPENFPMWYSMASKPMLAHTEFLTGLFSVWKFLDAPIYHTEVGPSNRASIIGFFEEWGKFSFFDEQPLWYSAPLHPNTSGMAKCRKPTQIIVFSTQPITMPRVKYSHEYVRAILSDPLNKAALKCFDPVLGKGLLARFAKQFNHACYGIEMNPRRLKCAFESIS